MYSESDPTNSAQVRLGVVCKKSFLSIGLKLVNSNDLLNVKSQSGKGRKSYAALLCLNWKSRDTPIGFAILSKWIDSRLCQQALHLCLLQNGRCQIKTNSAVIDCVEIETSLRYYIPFKGTGQKKKYFATLLPKERLLNFLFWIDEISNEAGNPLWFICEQCRLPF